jgi:pre-rRNA-processing protein TSR4
MVRYQEVSNWTPPQPVVKCDRNSLACLPVSSITTNLILARSACRLLAEGRKNHPAGSGGVTRVVTDTLPFLHSQNLPTKVNQNSMWSGNEECNEEGEPVRLYQPIQYGRTGVEPDDLTASYIGGPLHPHRRCPLCQESLVSVVQLHVSQANRTLRLWACNRSSCWRTLVATSKLHVGGGRGIVVAESLEVPAETVTATAPKPKSIVPRMATADTTCTTADDWGDVGGDASGLEDLEAKLASMETKKTPSKKSVKTKATTGTTQLPSAAAAGTSLFSLPLLSLYSTQEPPSRTTAVDARDVGLHGTSHRQIQDMLNRYLAAEDDTNLVQMLRGKTGADTGGSQETDQDLTAADFALLQFSDRIKRAPRQVLRYARGGEPLWSM